VCISFFFHWLARGKFAYGKLQMRLGIPGNFHDLMGECAERIGMLMDFSFLFLFLAVPFMGDSL